MCLEPSQQNSRDRLLVCLVGIAPGLDGIGIVVDFATRALGLPETNFYQTWHHHYGHDILAAVVLSLLAAVCGTQRIRVGLAAFVSVHLHFLCDLVNSRGTTTDDL